MTSRRTILGLRRLVSRGAPTENIDKKVCNRATNGRGEDINGLQRCIGAGQADRCARMLEIGTRLNELAYSCSDVARVKKTSASVPNGEGGGRQGRYLISQR